MMTVSCRCYNSCTLIKTMRMASSSNIDTTCVFHDLLIYMVCLVFLYFYASSFSKFYPQLVYSRLQYIEFFGDWSLRFSSFQFLYYWQSEIIINPDHFSKIRIENYRQNRYFVILISSILTSFNDNFFNKNTYRKIWLLYLLCQNKINWTITLTNYIIKTNDIMN